MEKFLLKTLLVVFIISTLSSVEKVLGAEQNTETTFETSNKWEVELTPYFWAAEIDGDATLRGRTGPVEVGFSDLLDNLDIAFMGRLEAWKGEWGLFVDGLYMGLGAEFSTPQGLVSADIDLKMTMLEFGIGYHLWETQVGKKGSQKLSFDLLGGGRYVNLEGEVDIVHGGPLGVLPGRTFTGRQEWVDPIIGGRLKWDVDEKLAAGVRFDFGGFGIVGCGLPRNPVPLARISDGQLAGFPGVRFWDVQYNPDALKLFKKVMLASASIPGAFPPVYFDVEIDGKKYDEMHVDGGVITGVFGYGMHLFKDVQDKGLCSFYIIKNGKLDVESEQVKRHVFPISVRSFSTLMKAQSWGDMLRLYNNAQRDNVEFNYISLPYGYQAKGDEMFDPEEGRHR